MKTYHVLTESAARELGIIDADGNELEHSATLAQVASVAESSHETWDRATEAAKATGAERWILDEFGDSQWIKP